MAVPKKRTGHSAQGHRRSNWKATKPETTICPNCGEVVLTHTVCTACGQYKGKVVSIKDPNYVAVSEVKEEAPKKKATKAKKAVKEEAVEEKAEVVEEAKVEAETETVAEEATEDKE